MTQPNFDDLVDRLFERRRQGEPISSLLATLPANLDEQAQRQIADLFTLEETLREIDAPRPFEGFAEGVMAKLKEPLATASSADGAVTLATWRIPTAAFIAASLLVALVMLPEVFKRPSAPNVVAVNPTTVPDQVSVSQTVRVGTEAYMELVQSVAETMQGEPISPLPAEQQIASVSPIGRALHGSSETIRTAGEGLRASVVPITDSALDAFGFLWRAGGPKENRPST